MALLSIADEGVEGIEGGLNAEGIILLFLILIFIALICGLVWIIIKAVDIMNEKKKYYQNLNKKEETKTS